MWFSIASKCKTVFISISNHKRNCFESVSILNMNFYIKIVCSQHKSFEEESFLMKTGKKNKRKTSGGNLKNKRTIKKNWKKKSTKSMSVFIYVESKLNDRGEQLISW